MLLAPRSDAPAPERILFARIQTLYAQLNDARPYTPEYERLVAEIHELAVAYDTLVAKQRHH